MRAGIEPRPDKRPSDSPRRLVGALVMSALLLAPFTCLVYDAGLAQSAAAVAGLGLLLALALGVAWASQRKEARG